MINLVTDLAVVILPVLAMIKVQVSQANRWLVISLFALRLLSARPPSVLFDDILTAWQRLRGDGSSAGIHFCISSVVRSDMSVTPHPMIEAVMAD